MGCRSRCPLQPSVGAVTLLLALTAAISSQASGQHQQLQLDPNVAERQGKGFLDFLGLGLDDNNDPYVSLTNKNCLNGDLAECFKSRAIDSFDDFFNKPVYQLSEHARILRMPESQLRSLAHENFEFSESPRADEPEWDQLLKFALRKVEKFLKSTAIEVEIDPEVTEHGRYSPRLIDEISEEIDIIEDKKDTLFNRKKLKKLFIPLLIILKLFKLKLLLFLPLILGLASFKKFLGFLAIIVPGVIAFFKLCKPNLSSFAGGHGGGGIGGLFNGGGSPHYSPAGISFQHHQQPYFKEPAVNYGGGYGGGYNSHSNSGPEYEYNPSHYSGNHLKSGGNGFTFQDGDSSSGQSLAYSGHYGHYRNNAGAEGSDAIQAEHKDVTETSSKKSILPDN